MAFRSIVCIAAWLVKRWKQEREREKVEKLLACFSVSTIRSHSLLVLCQLLLLSVVVVCAIGKVCLRERKSLKVAWLSASLNVVVVKWFLFLRAHSLNPLLLWAPLNYIDCDHCSALEQQQQQQKLCVRSNLKLQVNTVTTIIRHLDREKEREKKQSKKKKKLNSARLKRKAN